MVSKTILRRRERLESAIEEGLRYKDLDPVEKIKLADTLIANAMKLSRAARTSDVDTR